MLPLAHPTAPQAAVRVFQVCIHSHSRRADFFLSSVVPFIERWWSAQGLACRKEGVGDL